MKCFFVLLPMLAVATVAAQDVIDGDDVTVPSATHPAPWEIVGELIVGDSASASLIIEGDGEVDVGMGVTIGAQSSGSGVVELQGNSTTRGVLATEWLRKGDGTASLLFEGGIVRAKTSVVDFFQGFETGDITIGPAHAFIDSGEFDIGIGASLQGAGSVTKEGAGTLTLTGDHAIGRLYIGRGAGASWLPLLDGGTVHLHDEASLEATYLHLGGVRGKGALYLSGAGTRAEFSNNALIGAGGPGELRIENGAMLENQSGRVGQGQEGVGSVLVSGAGSLWRNSGADLYVGGDGSSGTGELRIEQGARVESVRTYIGRGASAVGTVTVTGANSRWETSAELEVGRGGEGTLLIEDDANVTSHIHLSGVTGSVGGWYDTPLGMVIIRDGGSWDNHGSVRVGHLGGGVGILTLADGGRLRTGLSDAERNRLSLAGQADSSGTLNIGAAADEDAAGAGVLEAAVVQFGDGDGRLVFNHTEADYQFDAALASDIDGGGVLLHQAGNTTLSADSAAFTGVTMVAGGRLAVNGQLGGTLTVEAGATLAGIGTVGDAVVADGGTLAPGNSIGTLTINGDLTLAGGAICDFEFGAPGTGVGAGDSVTVNGDLTLGGAVLNITDSGDLGPGLYRLFEYGGTLTGGLTVGTLPQDFPYVARIITAVPGEVRLLIRVPGPFYVDHSAAGANTGESWDDAFTDLQDALAIAGDGDEIRVAAGVYYPATPIDSSNVTVAERRVSFQLHDGVAIYGGFPPGGGEWEDRDWQTHVTVLSGDIDGNDDTDENGVVTDPDDINGANSYHVVIGHYIDETAVLDGFHITAGLADANIGDEGDGMGAGLYNNNGSPTLIHLRFSGNRANFGGGMYNINSSPTLAHVSFNGNQADIGGGMRNANDSSPLLTQVSFSGNRAGVYGGGMHNVGSSPTLVHVAFTDNSAGSSGGGIYNSVSSLTFTGGVLSGNTASRGGGLWNAGMPGRLTTLAGVGITGNAAQVTGGGVVNTGGARLLLINSLLEHNQTNGDGGGLRNASGTATLINTTVAGNTADGSGGGVFVRGGAVTLINGIAYGNTAGGSGGDLHNDPDGELVLSYSLYDADAVAGDVDIDSDSIDADPLFADPAGGDLRLLPGSPAIFAGTAEPYDEDGPAEGTGADLAGNPRLIDGLIDIGAYQNPGFVLATTPEAQSAPQGATYAPITVTVTPRDDTGFTDPGDYPLTGGEVQAAYPETGATVIFDGTADNPLMLVLDGHGQADTPEPVAAGGPGAFEIEFVMPGADAVNAQMQNIAVHTVTAEAQGQGTITPEEQTVIDGEDAEFAVAPAEGWHLVSVAGDSCTPTGQGDGHWMAENLTADCHVTAIFAINEYTVTATHSGNGSITPASQTVEHGTSAGFTLTPDNGWSLNSVNGTSCTPMWVAGDQWQAVNIQADCAVEVVFMINSYTVGGTVSGLASGNSVVLQNNGADDLALGTNGAFSFSPQADGSVYNVTVATQPSDPIQTCAVFDGTGTLAGAAVTDIEVRCNTEPASLVLNAIEINFGTLMSGQQDMRIVTLTSSGTGELEISQISPPDAPFELVGGNCLALPLQLPPGASCEIEIAFAPGANAAGQFESSIEIISNADSSPDQIVLRGTVNVPIPVPLLGPFGLILLALMLGMLAFRQRPGKPG